MPGREGGRNMKNFFVTTAAVTLLLFLFAIAFQAGKSAGFRTGSEWALLQAEIVAREAGMSLPVYFDDGAFRVVFRQPPGLYQKAWQIADRYDRAGGARQTAKLERVETDKICLQTDF
jgi:hypothetical protein